jgi:hypothetical protein
MNFDECLQEVKAANLEVHFEFLEKKASVLNNEALFHIPLLASVILFLAKLRRKPRTIEIGQLVGECLEATLVGFKGSAQKLGWSANLRVRTVYALRFLELKGYVVVDKSGIISCTETGKELISIALNMNDDLAYTLQQVEKFYRDICGEKSSQMELL